MTRSANRYIKIIKYGNRTPNRDTEWCATYPSCCPTRHGCSKSCLTTVNTIPSIRMSMTKASGQLVKIHLASSRSEPTAFADASCSTAFPKNSTCLVGSTDITYNQSPTASFVASVSQSSYVYRCGRAERYLKKSLPPLDLGCSQVPGVCKLAL